MGFKWLKKILSVIILKIQSLENIFQNSMSYNWKGGWLRLLTLTGSRPWLVNNVGFVLSVEKRLTKPNLLSYCFIIPKDSDVSINLSLTEHAGVFLSP